jgi:hypothetical protein
MGVGKKRRWKELAEPAGSPHGIRSAGEARPLHPRIGSGIPRAEDHGIPHPERMAEARHCKSPTKVREEPENKTGPRRACSPGPAPLVLLRAALPLFIGQAPAFMSHFPALSQALVLHVTLAGLVARAVLHLALAGLVAGAVLHVTLAGLVARAVLHLALAGLVAGAGLSQTPIAFISH